VKKRDRPKEVNWAVPLFGFALRVFLGQRHGADAEPGDIFLRSADSPEDAVQSPTVEEVTRSWEQRLKAEPISKLFHGVTPERLQAEELAEKLRYDVIKSISYPGQPPPPPSTGVFRTFAEIQPDPEGILSFANSYGNLTSNCPLLVWHEEVLAMRRALCVWESLQKKDLRKLRNHFQLQMVPKEKRGRGICDLPEYLSGFVNIFYKGSYLVFDSHPDTKPGSRPPFPDRRAKEPIGWEEFPREQWDSLFNEIDVAAVARAYLRQVINRRFDKHVTSTLYWSGPKTLTRILHARNLLGWLWLQFEESITGHKKYRACEGPGCGKWFEVSPAIARSDKKHLSDVCRVRAFQSRKRKADE